MGRKLKKRSIFSILTAIAIIAAVACAPKATSRSKNTSSSTVTNYTQCLMPSDQEGSLRGSWSVTPIKLVLDRDFYITDGGVQAVAIKKAIATWNAWSQLKGFNVFEVVEEGSGNSVGRYFPIHADEEGCDLSLFTGDATDNIVGIWKVRSGGDGRNSRGSCQLLEPRVQGQTEWYTEDGYTTRAVILLNFDDFNNPGKESLDIESLALHELGHVLGLYHSCNSGGEDITAPLCYADGSVVVGSRYSEAVMFPVLRNTQIRRALKPNDYDRVNCLY